MGFGGAAVGGGALQARAVCAACWAACARVVLLCSCGCCCGGVCAATLSASGARAVGGARAVVAHFIAQQPQVLCMSTPHVVTPTPRRQISIHSWDGDTSSSLVRRKAHGDISAWLARLTVWSPCAQPPSPELPSSTSDEGSTRGKSCVVSPPSEARCRGRRACAGAAQAYIFSACVRQCPEQSPHADVHRAPSGRQRPSTAGHFP